MAALLCISLPTNLSSRPGTCMSCCRRRVAAFGCSKTAPAANGTLLILRNHQSNATPHFVAAGSTLVTTPSHLRFLLDGTIRSLTAVQHSASISSPWSEKLKRGEICNAPVSPRALKPSNCYLLFVELCSIQSIAGSVLALTLGNSVPKSASPSVGKNCGTMASHHFMMSFGSR